jgi:hypothetical protein
LLFFLSTDFSNFFKENYFFQKYFIIRARIYIDEKSLNMDYNMDDKFIANMDKVDIHIQVQMPILLHGNHLAMSPVQNVHLTLLHPNPTTTAEQHRERRRPTPRWCRKSPAFNGEPGTPITTTWRQCTITNGRRRSTE